MVAKADFTDDTRDILQSLKALDNLSPSEKENLANVKFVVVENI